MTPTTAATASATRALFAALAFCVLVFVARAATSVPRGLRANYFSNGEFAGAPLFSQLDSEITTAHVTDAWRADVPSAFSVRWRGYIAVPRRADYEFTTTSDDASHVLIDGRLVVDNGGTHGPVTRRGRVTLDRGPHAVSIDYVQSGGPYALEWMWARAGDTPRAVPGWLLSPGRTSYGRAFASRALDWA
ncbi:MAG TPA: PA14 domain-containing protein, partial [Rhodanobacteraceae bacterium]